MTIFIEVSFPFQRKPGFFKSRLVYRVWWLWFAFTWLRVHFDEYARTDKVWEPK